MHEGGVASNMDVGAAADDLASAERERMRILEELAATNLDASALEADLDAEATRLEVDAQKARDRRDALAVAARDTTIRASAAGRIETLLVKSGDTVTPGSVVARIVPSDAARQIVAFLPERDRAFLRIGMDARLDLDQFPVTEFGFLHARVERIGSDIATVHEIREALGEQTPPSGAYYRVELVPRTTERTTNLESLVRPGSMLTARITLRERRLAAIVFEPVRRLLEGGT